MALESDEEVPLHTKRSCLDFGRVNVDLRQAPAAYAKHSSA